MFQARKQHGGFRRWARHYYHRTSGLLANPQLCESRLWNVDRLVFVCLGNICRSPFAECYAASLGLNCCSVGLDTIIDKPANPSAVAIAEEFGVDLKQHRTRPASQVERKDGDLWIVMEPYQLKRLKTIDEFCDEQLALLGLWTPARRSTISDPFGHDDIVFRYCFSSISQALDVLHRQLREAAAPVLSLPS